MAQHHPSAQSLQQRVQRFLEEDATTMMATTVFMSGVFAVREFRLIKSRHLAPALQRAVRKTLPFVPAFAASAAFGIVGIKLTVAAVQDVRRDYSRSSVLIAVPVFAALLHAPLGPRAMAKSAIGFGSFVCAVDYAASKWHHYKALKHEHEYNRLYATTGIADAHQYFHEDLHAPVFIAHGVDTHAPSAMLLSQHEPASLYRAA